MSDDRDQEPTGGSTGDERERSIVERARALLDAYRTDEPATPHLAALAALDEAALTPLRTDRDTALAVWITLYNAGTLHLLERRPALYESRFRTVRFFRAPCLTLAGTDLSLDDIEHGILRGSCSKYGLGYLPRLFPDRFERRYRLETVDPRVHFALNCGAASCPPIRFYEPDRIDEQLDLATRSYLETSVEYDAPAGTVSLPRVFRWYHGDFGGRSGIRSLLREYDVLPAGATPRLRYDSWDWSRETAFER